MEVLDLGLIDYAAALTQQENAVAAVVGQENERILVCEHPAVITVGRAIGSRDDIREGSGDKESGLKESGPASIPIFEVSRGGRSTLHLPGQIVIYPIVDLERRGKDLHAYMRMLETAIIETLADFRIAAVAREGKTGVWVENSRNGGEKKIASLGVAVKKWVTYHGLALNVTCDLALFKNLNPCGFSSNVMTSVIQEMPESYTTTWNLDSEKIYKRVKTRLIENLVENLTNDLAP